VKVEGLDPAKLLQLRALEPPVSPLLGARAALGSFALPRSPDGVVRGVPLLVNYARDEGEIHILPSAPLAAAMQLAGSRQLRYAEGRLRVGDKYVIPMNGSGFFYPIWGVPGPRIVSAWRVVVNLLDAQAGAPPHYPLELTGSPVVFSDSAAGLGALSTPLEGAVGRGVVYGQVLSSLISSRGIRRAPLRWDVTATFVLAFVGALAVTLRPLLRSGPRALLYLALLVGAGGAYLLFARGLFVSELRWVAVVGPLLALSGSWASATVYAVRTDLEVSDFVTHVLGRYVSPDVARQVFRNVALVHPEHRDVTVMFSDMEGFSQLSERLQPGQLAELLHEWLTEVTARVHERGGQVEYVGDSVMAFWGAPVRHANHAERACACALSMRGAIQEAQVLWERRYGQAVRFRTGIATGKALVGDLGSALKSNYTVLGEAVVWAVRLERANRRFGTAMLVSQTTAERCAKQFVFRELERVVLRSGRVESVYQLLGAQRDVTPVERKRLGQYEEALALYRMRQFAQAASQFEALAEGDEVCVLYAKRSRDLMAQPPPVEWDATADLRSEGEAA
jgi:adenylate cyclase